MVEATTSPSSRQASASPAKPAAENSDHLDPFIHRTLQGIGAHVQKPRLTADRLKRPPFRFLYDVVSALRDEFGEKGAPWLVQLQASGVPNSKDSKIAWLDEWARCLSAEIGFDVNISSLKIVCGQAPEDSNLLLQTSWEVIGQGLNKENARNEELGISHVPDRISGVRWSLAHWICIPQ
jgi:hypothetical protein